MRSRAATLNVAIDAFNRGIESLCRGVAEAQAGYNETLERARALAAGVAEPAQAQFDARSERWQDSETGTRVRSWIDAWEMTRAQRSGGGGRNLWTHPGNPGCGSGLGI